MFCMCMFCFACVHPISNAYAMYIFSVMASARIYVRAHAYACIA